MVDALAVRGSRVLPTNALIPDIILSKEPADVLAEACARANDPASNTIRDRAKPILTAILAAADYNVRRCGKCRNHAEQ